MAWFRREDKGLKAARECLLQYIQCDQEATDYFVSLKQNDPKTYSKLMRLPEWEVYSEIREGLEATLSEEE
jgi:hypothetical protein